jgi:hypothetical protein
MQSQQKNLGKKPRFYVLLFRYRRDAPQCARGLSVTGAITSFRTTPEMLVPLFCFAC